VSARQVRMCVALQMEPSSPSRVERRRADVCVHRMLNSAATAALWRGHTSLCCGDTRWRAYSCTRCLRCHQSSCKVCDKRVGARHGEWVWMHASVAHEAPAPLIHRGCLRCSASDGRPQAASQAAVTNCTHRKPAAQMQSGSWGGRTWKGGTPTRRSRAPWCSSTSRRGLAHCCQTRSARPPRPTATPRACGSSRGDEGGHSHGSSVCGCLRAT